MKTLILLSLLFYRNELIPLRRGWDFILEDYLFTSGRNNSYSLMFPLKFEGAPENPFININAYTRGYCRMGDSYFDLKHNGATGSSSLFKSNYRYNLYGELQLKAGLQIDNITFIDDISLFNKYEEESLSYRSPFYDPRYRLHSFDKQPVIGEQNYFDVRFNRGFILYEHPSGISILTGREYLSWGYNLLFSGYATSMDFIYRIRLKKGKLTAETFNAFLNDTFPGKRISGQTVELSILPGLVVSLEEAVIYTSSDNFKYFNPLGLYYEIQRRGKDNSDNLLGSINISWRVIRGVKLGFQFLDDDFIIGKGGTSKFGIHGDLTLVPWQRKNLMMRFTYTAIPRWTYTHVSDTNSASFLGTPLGYPRGNDLRDMSFSVYFLTPNRIKYISINYLAHGEGTLEEHWEGSGYPRNMPYPTGNSIKTLLITIGQKNEHHEISIFTEYEKRDDSENLNIGFLFLAKYSFLTIEF